MRCTLQRRTRGFPHSARDATRCALVGSPRTCAHKIHAALGRPGPQQHAAQPSATYATCPDTTWHRSALACSATRECNNTAQPAPVGPASRAHRTFHRCPLLGLARSAHTHTRGCKTQPSPPPLAHLAHSQDIARCPFRSSFAAQARDGPQHCPAPLWVSLSCPCGHHSCPSTYCCISLHIVH